MFLHRKKKVFLGLVGVCLALICLGLSPYSKIETILRMLQERNGFKDAQYLLPVVEIVETAHKAESKGKATTAQRYYKRAAKKILEALSENKIRQDETGKGQPPDIKRLLQLAWQYQTLYGLLQEIIPKIPPGSVKQLPQTLEALPFRAILQQAMAILDTRIQEDIRRAATGLEHAQGEIDETQQRYDNLVRLLGGKAEAEQEGVKVVQQDGKTVYKISVEEKVQEIQDALATQRAAFEAFEADLGKARNIPKELIPEDKAIPAFTEPAKPEEPMSGLVPLYQKVQEIRTMQSRGSLPRMVEALEKASTQGNVRHKLAKEIEDSTQTMAKVMKRIGPFQLMLRNLSAARIEMEEQKIIESLTHSRDRAREDWDQNNARARDQQETLAHALSQDRLDVARLMEHYDALLKARTEARRSIAKIAAVGAPVEGTLQGFEWDMTRRDVANFGDLLKVTREVRKDLYALDRHQEQIIELQNGLLNLTQAAVIQSLQGTSHAPALDSWLAQKRKDPPATSTKEILGWHAKVMEETHAYLEKRLKLILERLKRIHEEYAQSREELEKINEPLAEADKNFDALRIERPLAKRLAATEQRRQNIAERLQKERENLPRRVNEAIVKVVQETAGESGWKKSYEDLKKKADDLYYDTASILEKWDLWRDSVQELDSHFTASGQQLSLVAACCKHDIITRKAASEIAFNMTAFRTEYEGLKRQWEQLQSEAIDELIKQGINADLPSLNRKWKVLRDNWQEKTKPLGEFLRLYGPLSEFLGTSQGETVRRHINQIRGRIGSVQQQIGTLENAVRGLENRDVYSPQAIDGRAALVAEGNALKVNLEGATTQFSTTLNRLEDRLCSWVRLQGTTQEDVPGEIHQYLQTLDGLLKQVNPLIGKISAFHDEPPAPSTSAAASTPAPAVRGPSAAPTLTTDFITKFRTKCVLLNDKIGKDANLKKIVENFYREERNLADLKERLAKVGGEYLKLNAQEISLLTTLAEEIWKGSVVAKDLRKRIGFEPDPKVLMFLIHRLLSPVEAVSTYSYKLDDRGMQAAVEEAKTVVERIKTQATQHGLNPADIPVVLVRTDSFIDEKTLKEHVRKMIEREPGRYKIRKDGLEADMTIAQADLLWLPLKDWLEDRVKTGGRPITEGDVRQLQRDMPNVMQTFLDMEGEKKAERVRADNQLKKDGALPPGINPDNFDRYFVSSLRSDRTEIETLWIGATTVDFLNVLLADRAMDMTIQAFYQGKMDKAADFMGHHFTLIAQKRHGTNVNLLKSRLERARLENPNAVVIFCSQPFQKPWIEPIVRQALEKPEEPGTVKKVETPATDDLSLREEVVLLQAMGHARFDKTTYGKLLVEAHLEPWFILSGIPLAQARKDFRGIVEKLTKEDLREIGKLYASMHWHKENVILVLWLMQHKPSLMDKATRLKMLKSPMFYYHQLALHSWQKIAEMIANTPAGTHRILAETLIDLLDIDFMVGLSRDGKEEYFRIKDENVGEKTETGVKNLFERLADLPMRERIKELVDHHRTRAYVEFFQEGSNAIAAKVGSDFAMYQALLYLLQWKMGHNMTAAEFQEFLNNTQDIGGPHRLMPPEDLTAWQSASLQDILSSLHKALSLSVEDMGRNWDTFNKEQEDFRFRIYQVDALTPDLVRSAWSYIESLTDKWILSKDRPRWEDLIEEPRETTAGKGSSETNERAAGEEATSAAL